MKKLASVLGHALSGRRRISPGLYLAALVLPGGLAAMPVLWWLGHRREHRSREES